MIHIIEWLMIIYVLLLGVVAALKVAGILLCTWPGVMIVALCAEVGIFIAMAALAFLLEVFDGE